MEGILFLTGKICSLLMFFYQDLHAVNGPTLFCLICWCVSNYKNWDFILNYALILLI